MNDEIVVSILWLLAGAFVLMAAALGASYSNALVIVYVALATASLHVK
jgi:hypothetical protein